MVKIRLKRMGQKKAPFYRIVVADYYDPTKDPSVYSLNEEAAKKWLANGAQPTAEVAKLLKIAGVTK